MSVRAWVVSLALLSLTLLVRLFFMRNVPATRAVQPAIGEPDYRRITQSSGPGSQVRSNRGFGEDRDSIGATPPIGSRPRVWMALRPASEFAPTIRP